MDISFRWTFPLAFSQGKRFRQQQFGGAQNFLGVFWGPSQDLASNLIIVLLLSMSVDLQICHLSSVRYIRQECLGMYLGFDLMFTLFDCEFNLSLNIHSAFNSLVRIKFISLLDEFSNKQHKVEYINCPFRNKTQVRFILFASWDWTFSSCIKMFLHFVINKPPPKNYISIIPTAIPTTLLLIAGDLQTALAWLTS